MLNQLLSPAIETLMLWKDVFIANLPNLVIAIIVLFIISKIAKYVTNLIEKGVETATKNTLAAKILGNISKFFIYLLGLFVVLGLLNLDKSLMSLLAGAGVIGLALGFAFQDIAENFIAGVLIAFQKPFAEGDMITTNGYLGIIQNVTLRSTNIKTPQGEFVSIPNASVFKNPLTNYTKLGTRRVDIACGVSYSDDLEKAESVVIESVKKLKWNINKDDSGCLYNEFGGSSINFTVFFWVEAENYLVAYSDAIKQIKKDFDANNVNIPFSTHTIEFSEDLNNLFQKK